MRVCRPKNLGGLGIPDLANSLGRSGSAGYGSNGQTMIDRGRASQLQLHRQNLSSSERASPSRLAMAKGLVSGKTDG